MSFSPAKPRRPAASPNPASSARLASATKKRALPYALLGVLLIALCVLGSVVTSVDSSSRSAVLAVASTIRAGQVIQAADLVSVQVAAGPGVKVIPVGESGEVVGKTAAVTLTAGSLMTRADVGASTVPASGQAVVSVLVKFGSYPADLAAGATVAVATGSPSGASSAVVAPVPLSGDPQATVVSVMAASSNDGSVAVELMTAPGSAGQIAAIPAGEVQLITVTSGGM
jgi:hypothetical protein